MAPAKRKRAVAAADKAAPPYAYTTTLGYADQGPADVHLKLDDGAELPCHSVLIQSWSVVLRDLMRDTAAGADGAGAADGSRAVPVQGDLVEQWIAVLLMMYKYQRGQTVTFDAKSAHIALGTADKYNMPGLATLALNWQNSQYEQTALRDDVLNIDHPWAVALAAEQWGHSELMDTIVADVAKRPQLYGDLVTEMVDDKRQGRLGMFATKLLQALHARCEKAVHTSEKFKRLLGACDTLWADVDAQQWRDWDALGDWASVLDTMTDSDRDEDEEGDAEDEEDEDED